LCEADEELIPPLQVRASKQDCLKVELANQGVCGSEEEADEATNEEADEPAG
jgi:hypothetical protein